MVLGLANGRASGRRRPVPEHTLRLYPAAAFSGGYASRPGRGFAKGCTVRGRHHADAGPLRRACRHCRDRKHRWSGACYISGRTRRVVLALAERRAGHGHEICRGHACSPLSRTRRRRSLVGRTNVYHQKRAGSPLHASGTLLCFFRRARRSRHGQRYPGRRDKQCSKDANNGAFHGPCS